MGRLSPADGSRLLQTLHDLYSLAPPEAFPATVLRAVRALIPCDGASFNMVELASGRVRALADPMDSSGGSLVPAFAAHLHQHPVIAHVTATGDRRALAISDFLQPVDFHRLGLYGDFFRLLGFEDQLSVSVPVEAGRWIVGVALNRAGHFGDVDRQLLDALAPHVATAYRNTVRYAASLRSEPSGSDLVGQAAAALARLTDRQLEVLRLLAGGASTWEIARRLDVSAATVRKHLENVFTRLGVGSRVQATRLYLVAAPPHGSDQPPWDVDVAMEGWQPAL